MLECLIPITANYPIAWIRFNAEYTCTLSHSPGSESGMPP